MDGPLECTSCGACCAVAAGPEYVGVTATDVSRLPAWARGRVIETASFRAVELNGTRCTFLVGTPGQAVRCAVYSSRPTTCGAYAVGGDDCVAARDRLEVR